MISMLSLRHPARVLPHSNNMAADVAVNSEGGVQISDRYDADPQVLGDDFAGLRMQDNDSKAS